MNKADLADQGMSSRWMEHFRKQKLNVRLIQATGLKTKEILSAIENATAEAVERAAARGSQKTVRDGCRGVPNVGKSTFINRLHGGSIAETGDRPGVTRSNQWIKISPYLELLDTPACSGPGWMISLRQRLCYLGTVKDEILDLEELALHLLDDLADTVPDQGDGAVPSEG